MTYGGTGRQLKSEFLVAPGADPSLIRLAYSEPVSIDAQGNLLAGADFQEAVPEIYQQIGSRARENRRPLPLARRAYRRL